MSLTKKGPAFFATAIVAMAFTAVAAMACTNLATLNLSSASGSVGDTVTLTGSSFSVPRKAGDPMVPVALHWNGVDGAVLAEATPDSAGNISASFTVPDGSAGYYVIVATQKNAEGVDQYGTPARASYQILGPNGESVVQPAGSETPAVATEPSSTGMIALTVGLGVLGLALFAAGFTAFVRQGRGRSVPVPSKARNE
ncbi:MAG TPA: hypothetical protein VGV63_07200 [Acidimicrobiales bacterium]|nr:hypothetical protein [Acidimicrobiales bacterium]